MNKKLVLTMLLIVFAVSLFLAACDNSGAAGFEIDEYVAPSTSGSSAIVMPTDIPATASEPTLQIHYYRTNSADYKTWGFWLWADGKDGDVYNLQYQDDIGGVTICPVSTFGTNVTKIGLIPRLQSGWTKDCDDDRYINLSDYELDANNYYHIYLTQGDKNLYSDVKSMKYCVTAAFSSEKQIEISTKEPMQYIKIYEGSEVLAETQTTDTISVRYNLGSSKTPDLNKEYKVEVQFANSDVTTTETVSIIALYATDSFNQTYYYDGELGAIYTSSDTTFKVWSPVSTKIYVNIYNSGHLQETPTTYEMTKGEKGVFECVVSGDLEAKYYTYTVYNSTYPTGQEIVDPYAKSAGLNGVRGQIVDFSKTNPTGWDDISVINYDRKELVVWETTVPDVTSSSTWTGTEAYRKKFLGVIESGTTYTQATKNGDVTVTTGFDHIKELGVNAVQIVPVFDQANDESNVTFNWGYNPLNYNVLEGAYSTDPTDGYTRIREFKQLVMSFNQAGINVIMDVVYNHVNSSSGSNFDVLMPGYYFRYNEDGTISNGSGCGNETASDHLMFRKFMIDSVCFWANEYKLGGFRFDLMGLHDIETMNLLTDALADINPSITVYGEPWTGGSSSLDESLRAVQKNTNSLTGAGQFNDQMRDALIKGGMKGDSEVGWVTNDNTVSNSDVNTIINGLKGMTGSTITDPNKTVNYVTCHDNYTLYDRIVASGVKSSNWQKIQNMAVLANAVVLTSNGTTFMLAGEEFLRTKGGNDNSYNASYKVNELDYSLKVTNYDVFSVYQKLVQFKTTCSGVHLEENEIADNYKVTSVANGSAIEIIVNDSKNNRVYKIIHANGTLGSYTTDFSGYTLYLDSLSTGVELTATTAIKPYQTIIAYK